MNHSSPTPTKPVRFLPGNLFLQETPEPVQQELIEQLEANCRANPSLGDLTVFLHMAIKRLPEEMDELLENSPLLAERYERMKELAKEQMVVGICLKDGKIQVKCLAAFWPDSHTVEQVIDILNTFYKPTMNTDYLATEETKGHTPTDLPRIQFSMN